MQIPFRPIARQLAHLVHPAPKVDLSAAEQFLLNTKQVNGDEGVLITVNHYSAPDFHAWWFAILISAFFPAEIHWVVTSGWTNSGWLTGFTHWLFPRSARLLGFTPMPAMPPDPAEVELRALAVRQVLKYANHASRPVIGMAPEGGDTPGGVLSRLYPGVGRFLHLISLSCPNILPVGVWTENGVIHLTFGSPYRLDIPQLSSTHELDRIVEDIVMHGIAVLLPQRLQGVWGSPSS